MIKSKPSFMKLREGHCLLHHMITFCGSRSKSFETLLKLSLRKHTFACLESFEYLHANRRVTTQYMAYKQRLI